jgi:CCR4-NOT transcription complex subunit 7/8
MSRHSAAHQQQQQWRRRRQHGEVFVRLVTAANLVQELSTIRALLESYPYVTVHAEHHGGGGGDEEGNNLPPGVRIDDLPAASRYGLAKVDVDSSVPYSQLGITLCDANGRLPVLPATPWPPGAAAAGQSVWQVGLHDRNYSGSVSVSGGGVSSLSVRAFAYALFATGVVSAETRRSTAVTWVAYGGLYHLGFLLKVLTGGARLPDTKEEFLASLRAYLGDRVFDGRYVAARLPGDEVSLKGTLTHMASLLGAPAATAAKEPWQAGERSLVACQVFMRLKGLFFAWDSVDMHAGCIHGLHSPTSSSS